MRVYMLLMQGFNYASEMLFCYKVIIITETAIKSKDNTMCEEKPDDRSPENTEL